MPFVCEVCREEFDKPAPLPRTGFVGRYIPRCPQGHPLRRVSGASGGWLLSFVGAAFLIFTCYWGFGVMISVFGDVRTAIFVIAAIYALIVIGWFIFTIAQWHKFRSSDLLRKYSKGPAAQIFGTIAGTVLIVWLAHGRYVAPVEHSELLLNSGNYVGTDISVEGIARNIYTNSAEGFAVIDLDGPNVSVQVNDLTKVPKEGDRVHSFGRVGRNRFGGIVLDEFIRWN